MTNRFLSIDQGLPATDFNENKVYRVSCGGVLCEYEIKAYRYIERANLLVRNGGEQLAMRLLMEGEQEIADEFVITGDRKAIIVLGQGQEAPEGFAKHGATRLATKALGSFEQAPDNTQLVACPGEHRLAITIPENAQVPEGKFRVQSENEFKISVGHELSAKSGYIIKPDRLVIRKPARRRRLSFTVSGGQVNLPLVIQKSISQLGVLTNDDEEIEFVVRHGEHQLAIAERETLPEGTGFVVTPGLGIRILNDQNNMFVVEPGKEQLEVSALGANQDPPAAAGLVAGLVVQRNNRRLWFREGEVVHPFTVQHSSRRLLIPVLLTQAPAVHAQPFFVLQRGEHKLAIKVLEGPLPANTMFVVHPQLRIEICQDHGNVFAVQPGVNLTTDGGENPPDGAGLVVQHNERRLWFREGEVVHPFTVQHSTRQLSIQVFNQVAIVRAEPRFFVLKRGKHQLRIEVLNEGQLQDNTTFVVHPQLRIEIRQNHGNVFAVQPGVNLTTGVLDRGENPSGLVIQHNKRRLWFREGEVVHPFTVQHSTRRLSIQVFNQVAIVRAQPEFFVLKRGRHQLRIKVLDEEAQLPANTTFVVHPQLEIEIRRNHGNVFAVQPGVNLTTVVLDGGENPSGLVVQHNERRLWFREGEVVHPFIVQHLSRRLSIQVFNQVAIVHAQPEFFLLKRGNHQLKIEVLANGEGQLPANTTFVVHPQLGIEIRQNYGNDVFTVQPGVTTRVLDGGANPPDGAGLVVQHNERRLWFREGEVVHPFIVQHSSRRLSIQVFNQVAIVHAQPEFFLLKRGNHQLKIEVLANGEGQLPANTTFVVHPQLGIEIRENHGNDVFAVQPGVTTRVLDGGANPPDGAGLVVQHNERRLWFREGEVVHPFIVQHSSRRLSIQVFNQVAIVHAQPEFFLLKRGNHQLKIEVLANGEGQLPANTTFVVHPQLGIEIRENHGNDVFAVQPGVTTRVLDGGANPPDGAGLVVQHNERRLWFRENGVVVENNAFNFQCSNHEVRIRVMDQNDENQFILEHGPSRLAVLPPDDDGTEFTIHPGVERFNLEVAEGGNHENPIYIAGPQLVIGIKLANQEPGVDWQRVLAGNPDVVYSNNQIDNQAVEKLLTFNPGNRHFRITIPRFGNGMTFSVGPPQPQQPEVVVQ